MKKKVVCAMSGGVDSSVTAALLGRQGYEVIGVTMQIWPDAPAESERACCSLSAVEDARRVAARLNIPHYTLQLRDEFQKLVIDPFIQAYREARTPNPCIACNRFLKFGLLLERGRELGAEYIATGHYARIAHENGRHFLRRGVDARKDQTYALYGMTQEQLSHTLLPLGELEKPRVRETAAELGFRVASKPDSQEICFVPDNNYRHFLRENAPECLESGDIVNMEGNKLGRHDGIACYTIGQRRGLGISTPEPIFVTDLDPNRNRVIVGPAEALMSDTALAEDVIFGKWTPEELTKPRPVLAMARYKMPAQPATAQFHDGILTVIFDSPQRAITPGQALVCYDGEDVVCGGTIIGAGRGEA